MTTQELPQSDNLIFILPFVLAVMYLGFYVLTGVDLGGHDVDVDADADFDAGADVDHDVGIDHDLDHDVDGDADSDSEGGGESVSSHVLFLHALSWVGVGRMPLSLVLVILLMCWGTIGFCANQFQHNLAISIAVALLGSLGITNVVSLIAGRTVFSHKNIARRRHALLGSRGEAMYEIDDRFGMACGRDDRGEFFQVACRIKAGGQPIAKGSAIQLTAYSAADRMFLIEPADSSNTPRLLHGHPPRG